MIRLRAVSVAGLVFLLAYIPLAGTGCTYARARGYDLLDVASVGVGYGLGLNIHVQASELLHASFGASTSHMYGTRGRYVGYWREGNVGWPVTFLVFGTMEPENPKMEAYQGQVLLFTLIPLTDWESVLYVSPSLAGPAPAEEEKHFCVVNPLFTRHVAGPHGIGMISGAIPEEYHPNGEVSAGFLLGVIGARVALDVVELGDFLAGIFMLDPAGDDPAPGYFRPGRPERPIYRYEIPGAPE